MVSTWRKYPNTDSKVSATTIPIPSTHSVEMLWCTSTLSMTSWKNIGEASARKCMAMAANAMSRRAERCFMISGKNHRNPKGWFSWGRSKARLAKKISPPQSVQNVLRPIAKGTAALSASGFSTMILPSLAGLTPTTMTQLPSVMRAISGKTPVCANRASQLSLSCLAFSPISVAMRSTVAGLGSSLLSA